MSFPSFLRKEQVSGLKARLSEIAQYALARRLTLLFGGGFSKDARGLPTGAELARSLISATYGCDESVAVDIARRYELAAVAQQYKDETIGKAAGLVEFVAEALRTSGDLSPVEKAFATLASISKLRRVFTTNFDALLEKALGPRAYLVSPTIKSISDFENASRNDDWTGVFHINGDLSDPKLTEDQLRDHRSPFIEELRHELLSNVLVMVGYSFRDDAITKVYSEIGDLLRAIRHERQNIVVMPIDDPYEYVIAQKIWDKRCGIILFPMGAGAFLHELVLSIREARYGESVKDISGILKQSPEQIKERLRPLRDRYSPDMTQDDIAEIYKQMISVRHI